MTRYHRIELIELVVAPKLFHAPQCRSRPAFLCLRNRVRHNVDACVGLESQAPQDLPPVRPAAPQLQNRPSLLYGNALD